MSTNNNIVSTGFITIVDLSDPVISSTEPPSPVEDMLWMDTSVTPPVLKIYKSGNWTPISDVGSSTPDTITTGGYFKGDLIINKNATGLDSNGDVQVKGGSFVHPNGGTFTIPSNKYVVANLNRGEGRNRYIVFIGHDSSRFSFLSDNESRHFIAATYKDKQWFYYINGIQTPFTPGDNDCIVAKVEENTNINSIKRIIRYYENQDSVFEALTEGGTIQGIYKKDGMLFVSAEVVATGKLRSAKGNSEFDLDSGTFRLGGTSSTDYKMKFDGTDLYFANGSIKWENLDGNTQENLRNITVSIIDGVRSVVVNANNEIQTNPTVYRAKVMLGTDDITNSCTISWTASGIYTGTASGSTFTPAKGSYTINESYVEVIATYKGKQFKDRIGISVSKQGATGAQGPQGLQGIQGPQGNQGIPGTPGQTYYTWIKYADDASGTGISDSPTGKKYIGFAYNKTTATESSTPSDYSWSLIQGEKGDTGVQGPAGTNGTTYYTWIKYSDNANGNPCYDTPTSSTQYIGIAVNQTTPTESSDYTRYTWSKFKGDQGVRGEQGIQGPAGVDGKTTYFHIKYSSVSNPTSSSQITETPDTYIGTYVDYIEADSTDPAKYTWSRFQGLQGESGEQGIPGVNGADGKTTYLHIKYSNDGGASFTANNGETVGTYIGTCTDFNQADPVSVSAYTWAKIKGEQGVQGVPGPAGADGKTYYTWIKYANDASGTGMSDLPDGKKYIGMAYNKETAVESTNAGDYSWSLIQGPQGIQGPAGSNGVTYYTWLKYADTPTSGMSDSPDGKKYMGLAYNKTTATESTNYSDYSWSLIKGEDGQQGATGPQGPAGATGKGISSITEYYLATSSASGVTTSTSGWSTSIQTVTSSKKYLWNYEKITYTDSSYEVTTPVIIGAYGDTGAAGKGISSITEYYLATSSASGVTTSTSGWSTSVQTVTSSKKYLWNYEIIKYTDGSSNTTAPVIIGAYGDTGATGPQGPTGATGPQGPAGKSVTSVDVEYAIHTSATTAPTSGWQTTSPTWVDGKYIWSRTKTTYSSGDPTYTNPACITGGKGATGATGKGVKSTAVTYQASTSGTTTPTGTWSSTIPTVSAGQYLWTRTVIAYTDGTSSTFYSIGKMGEQGPQGATGATGATGKGVKSTAVTYQASTSGTTTPTGTWSSTVPTVSAGQYLWTRTVITYTDDTSTTSYSIGKMGEQGPQGATGATGATGTGIQSITELYKILNTKAQQPTPTSDTGWSTTPPTWSSGMYIHTCSKIVYKNPSSTVYTTPVCDSSWEAVNGVEVGGRNLIAKNSNLTYDKYLNELGNQQSSAGWCFTDYIPVIADKQYIASGYSNLGTSPATCFYDSSKVFVSGIKNNNSVSQATEETMKNDKRKLVTIPSGCAYMRFSFMKTDLDKIKLELGNKTTDWTPAPEDTVSSVDTMYYLSTSPITQAGGSWIKTLPSVTANKFIWTKTVTTYAAGNTSETIPILYQPEWIQDWGGTQTTIGGTSVLSPKIFAGTKDSNGYVTGVAMGVDIFGQGENFSGLAGYQNGVKSYHFKTDGTFLIGQNLAGNYISWNGDLLEIKGDIRGSKIEGSKIISTKILDDDTDDVMGEIEDEIWDQGFDDLDVKIVNINGARLYSATKIGDKIRTVEIDGNTICLRNKLLTSMSSSSSTIIADDKFEMRTSQSGVIIRFDQDAVLSNGILARFNGNVYVSKSLLLTDIANSTVAGGQNVTATTNVTDLNKIWKSGFYDCNGGANIPFGGWNWVIHAGHTSNNSGGAYNYGMQIAGANQTNNFAIRTVNHLGQGSWNTLYHTGNKPTPAAIGAYAWSEWNTWKDTNGYAKLPTGIILQWGYTTIAPAAANAVTSSTVYFPVSFPNSCRFVTATPRSTVPDRLTTSCINSSNSSFELYMTRTNTTETGYVWFAIGY